MNAIESSTFVRRVGFGLAPHESSPADPVAWATAQLDKAPPVAFYADRSGGLFTHLPPEVKLLQTQAEACEALAQTIDSRRQVRQASRSLGKDEFVQLRYNKLAFPFIVMSAWKETLARGCMAVNGPAPVFERFWHFWANHFTVAPSINNVSWATVGPYMRMLRKRMEGNFRDLLFEATTHPAMVLYLDNASSTGAKSPMRVANRTQDEINENLGRELLELFTITPAAGYTQDDVVAVTNILTGWGVALQGVNKGGVFDFKRHEPGTHTVMGKSYSAVLRPDGKLHELVDDLAVHPLTAQHICKKLATAFVSETPPPDCVARLVQIFQSSKGHLPSLHKAVVQEVARYLAQHHTFSEPQAWLWTTYRTTGTPLPADLPQRGTRNERLPNTLTELGQPLHDCPQPNGWPLLSRDWISREMMDRRVRYAYQLAPRIPQGEQTLSRILEQQHSSNGSLAQKMTALKGKGHAVNDLWAAYLVSPEFLWSKA